MMPMSCREWREKITDQVRGQALPDQSLDAHLDTCPGCEQFWESEQRLSGEFAILSRSISANPNRLAMRAKLLEEFDRHHASRRRSAPRFLWAAAAMLLLCACLGAAVLWKRRAAKVDMAEAGDATYSVRASAESNRFVPVPFMPPLASGELVTVVRAKLPPEALLRMGLAPQTADGREVNAEIMMGEDGFPRAVRVY